MERYARVSAHRAPEAMEEPHNRFEREWDRGEIDPLLLIPTFVMDFLCIHPFTFGSGRMARLLSLLLLYRAGLEIGRYISLEKLIESQCHGYYDALYKSSQQWHEAATPCCLGGSIFLGSCCWKPTADSSSARES